MEVLLFVFIVNYHLHFVLSHVHHLSLRSNRAYTSMMGDSLANIIPILSIGSAAVSTIPLSMAIDKYMQNGTSRIKTIANTEIVDEYGEVYAYISRPSSSNISPRPVVFLVHQFFGLRQRDTELCDELSRLGYVAVAPDCYQGNNTGLIPRAISLVSKAAYNDDFELPLRDFHRVVQYLKEQSWADMSNICICGFCFGGGVALRYANKYPENIKACGIFYGKPIKAIDKLQAKIYGVYGSQDRQFTPSMIDSFENLLRLKNIDVQIRRYEGQAHAFIEDLDCIKNGGDAGDAWSGWIDLLRNELQPVRS